MATQKANFSLMRIAISIIIGLAGATVIWVFAPYNNHLFTNSFISDTYIPELAVGIMLFLICLLNPLLIIISKKIEKPLYFSVRQFLLIFIIMLIASTHIGGLMRLLPFSLPRASNDASKDKQLAQVYVKMYKDGLPESLLIDKVKVNASNKDFEASSMFVDKLKSGKSIPWGKWLKPLLMWGLLLLGFWTMCGGMGLIVYPQWRNNERIPFPLISVYQSLVEKKEETSFLPDIFRNKLFWTAFAIVFIIHGFNGLNLFTKGMFPPFPLRWELFKAFSDPPWKYMEYFAQTAKIYFVFVGITFFMPNRIGFSLWFTFVLYQLYSMFGYTFIPGFNYGPMVNDQRNGAAIALACIIVYLGRRHWATVLKAMFSTSETDEDRRNRTAGWMFVVGNIIMTSWLLYVGVSLFWTVAIIAIFFIVTLVMARVVAETGMPLMSLIDFKILYFIKLFPVKMTTAISVFIGGFCDYILSFSTRTTPIVPLIHAFGVDKKTTPRQQTRLTYLFIAVLAIGVVVCGIATVDMGYHYATSLDGTQKLSWWGSDLIYRTHNQLQEYARGAWQGQNYSQVSHLTAGFIIATVLQVLCLMIPQWPLHPVGLVMVGTWYMGQAWASVCLGWFLKMAIVKYGGAKAYNIAKPFFLGLIISEICCAILWAIVPLILIWMGYDPGDIGRLPVIPR